MRRNLTLVLAGLLLLLSGCMEVKENITINRDGSGRSDITIVVHREYAALVVPGLREFFSEQMPGTQLKVDHDQRTGNEIVSYSIEFSDASQIKEGLKRYSLAHASGGLFQTRYTFEGRASAAEHSKQTFEPPKFDVPIPFEVTVRLPGSIDQTNGEKVDSNTVRWQWVGEKGGGNLTATSSAFGGPNAGWSFGPLASDQKGDSLSSADESSLLDSLLYKRYRVFRDDQGDIWVEDLDSGKKTLVHKLSGRSYSPLLAVDEGNVAFMEMGMTEAARPDVDKKHIFVHEISSSKTRQLDVAPGYVTLMFPRSLHVVFARRVPGLGYALLDGESFVVDLRTDARSTLPRKSDPMFSPASSKGGHLKCFDRETILSPDQGSLAFVRVCREGASNNADSPPKWSFDADKDTWSVWHFDLKSQRLTQLSPADPNVRREGPVPILIDGQKVYLRNAGGNDGLLSYDLSTGKSAAMLGAKRPYASEDQTKIAFLTAAPGAPQIHILDVRSGRTSSRDLKPLPATGSGVGSAVAFRWSSDGGLLYLLLPSASGGKTETWRFGVRDGISEGRRLSEEESKRLKVPALVRIPRYPGLSADVLHLALFGLAALVMAGTVWGGYRIVQRRKVVKSASIAIAPRRASAFCTQCGTAIEVGAAFCDQCGSRVG